jgi:tRNA-guanine family transglycosylase
METIKFIPAPGSPAAGRFDMTYVPAQMQHIFENRFFKEYKLSFWEENSFFKYNSMLISAFYGMKWNNFREFFKFPNDFILIGDSGGFQNMTMNAHLDPVEVLRWQEKHCQVGLTFDHPIFGDDTPKRKKEKQLQTALNAKMAYENRKNKDMKLYAVFQGHSCKEQEYMLKCYEDNIPLNKFDGIAIGGLVPISGDIELLVKILTLFCHNVYKYKLPVHFFGLSGNKVAPYIKYLSHRYKLDITFDSSSYGAGAIRREYWKGNGLEKINISDIKDEDLPCKCPLCSKVIKTAELQKDGTIAGGLISLHNLWQTIEHIENIKKEDIKLNDKYKQFIDIMYDKGPDNAFQILDKLPEQTTIQQSIFNY